MLSVLWDVIEVGVNEVIERIINRFSKNTPYKRAGVALPTNTNLTREKAVELLKGFDVLCPKCGGAKLAERHSKRVQNKARNSVYKCPSCGEVYRPCKLI